MDQPHVRFAIDSQYGFVAAPTDRFPDHLAHWYLVREQFVPVLEAPGLYRLTHPHRDGLRRTRQAVHDLRRRWTVHADDVLDAAPHTAPSALTAQRSQAARAAAASSPQYDRSLESPPLGAAVPSPPSRAPRAAAPRRGRGR
ncbi:hypothetical protein [Streptomyces paromomycinus]|uniref:Uncharacterized protein n=1 Tax=Streptomyces paromomycinus TaxID=92743 RepID=A0A401VXS0_STREY|nr:hypothetical protein [Streptomyces paromomycinus]GCD41862.1 hypothetical protein GKJPGBOP_01519 [Streptomyces paromomycinus]